LHIFLHILFLADRTNGRAYATVLRLSVCLSVCLRRYVLWLNGASLKGQTRDPNMLRAQYLENYLS